MYCPSITVDFHEKWSRIKKIINKNRVEKMFENWFSSRKYILKRTYNKLISGIFVLKWAILYPLPTQ